MYEAFAEEVAQPAEEPVVGIGVIEALEDQQAEHGDGVVAAVSHVQPVVRPP